jgi:hypothetical protein
MLTYRGRRIARNRKGAVLAAAGVKRTMSPFPGLRRSHRTDYSPAKPSFAPHRRSTGSGAYRISVFTTWLRELREFRHVAIESNLAIGRQRSFHRRTSQIS